VTDEDGTAWSLLAGDPPSIAAVVDVPLARAGGGPRRSTSLAFAGGFVWAPADQGILRLSPDGAERGVVDLGTRPSAIAAGEGSLWATTAWSGVLMRVGLDGHDVTRIDLGGPLDAVVAGTEGAWAFRRSDNVLLHVAPTGQRVIGELQLEGGCWGIELTQSEVVVAFTTNRAMKGGLARVSRSTGDLVGVVQREGLPSGFVSFHGTAAVAVDLHDDLRDVILDEDAPMPEARSAIERVDLRRGDLLGTVPVAGQIMDLVGDASRLWARVFSRDAQAIHVVPIDPVSGSVGAAIDFSAVDLSGFSDPPARDFRPFPDLAPRPERATSPTSVEEVEARVRKAADESVHSTVQGWSGRTGEPLPPRPYIPGFTFELVRLAGQHPNTRLQFVFRSEQHADCRFGWEMGLWHDDEDPEGDDDGDEDSGLPDPESYAGEILGTLMENLEAAGYGPPDECDPDDEGITWVRNPYGGKPSWDWGFGERVEYALRQYVPSARPVTRKDVQRLLATGVDSAEALVPIVTSDRSDDLASAALWLLTDLGGASAVPSLLTALEGSDEESRLRAVAKLQQLATREHEPELQLACLAETAPQVRAALMDSLFAGGTATRDLALRVLVDHSEPPVVRAAAARTLGCTSVGEPEVIAALTSALGDTDPDVAVGAARGLALCVPSQAEHLLSGLVDDIRVTSDGSRSVGVGNAVSEEIEMLARRCH